ncbi:nitrate reductase molybdenum cofactor assembly chaperone [Neptunomonas japonica]|uniref:nitrate reductase molybdenum cofactor assembly chaperone n=1 Tax=Neptunomonas japonica TaxID=417574 RepID=UPI0004286179|nr:nitrate reductase molybdenum cofactor assembly chaperone [Neptunomonas japonica]
MRSLKVISLLLDYPSDELLEIQQELIEEIRADKALPEGQRAPLIEFIDQLCTTDLLDAQDNYVGLFDRGRSLSLLLFEHVHGESRDRGQAMVDLMAVYEDNGFQIDAKELPDYIPLFLEYLSKRPMEEVQQWLGDVSHILALLETRLDQRKSFYAVLCTALIEISGVEVERKELVAKVATEAADDTPEALDKVWEEEMVRFTEPATQDCGNDAVTQRRRELDQVQQLHISDAVKHITPTGPSGS